jgi:hypothetical protein
MDCDFGDAGGVGRAVCYLGKVKGSLVRFTWVNFLQYERSGLRQTGQAQGEMSQGDNSKKGALSG